MLCRPLNSRSLSEFAFVTKPIPSCKIKLKLHHYIHRAKTISKNTDLPKSIEDHQVTWPDYPEQWWLCELTFLVATGRASLDRDETSVPSFRLSAFPGNVALHTHGDRMRLWINVPYVMKDHIKISITISQSENINWWNYVACEI